MAWASGPNTRGQPLSLLAGAAAAQSAPGAPGETPTWAYAAMGGAGTAYEAYVDGAYRAGGPTGAVSKVWFSIADGVLTETMYGLIHEAQIKQLRLAVATDSGTSSALGSTSGRASTASASEP